MSVCEKHDQMMDRLFTTINRIEQRQESMESKFDTKLDEVIQFKNEIHKIVYGNGQEGLTSKMRRALSQLTLQWAILVLIVASILTYSLANLGG